VDWLEAQRESEWITALSAGVVEAPQLLEAVPLAGAPVSVGRAAQLRKLVLRRVPFLVWYFVPIRPPYTVWLARLFHTRQRQPRPSLARWTARR
jgi:hypothetical protein